MPAFSSNEHRVYYFEEASFGVGVADYGVSGVAFFCVEPNFAGLKRSNVPNDNYRVRAYGQHDQVRGLRNGTLSFGCYHHGKGTAAITAEGAFATTYFLPDLLRNCFGGRRLGRASGIAGGTAAIPDVDPAEGANWSPGDWGFAIDVTTGAGEFVRVESISTDSLTLVFDMSFTPDGGGADGLGAVIVNYIDTDAMVNRGDANHVTHSFFHEGDKVDDLQEGNGCKLNLTAIEGLEQGGEPLFRFEVMAATHVNEGLSAPTVPTTIVGDDPLVVALGRDSTLKIATVGSNPVAVEAYSITLNPGASSKPVPGIGGLEGRLGYTATGFMETTVEVVLDYDDSWATEFDTTPNVVKHLLLQVGTEQGRAIGYYFPRLEYDDDAEPTVSDDLSTVTLRFKATEYRGTETVAGDTAENYYSKAQILHSA